MTTSNDTYVVTVTKVGHEVEVIERHTFTSLKKAVIVYTRMARRYRKPGHHVRIVKAGQLPTMPSVTIAETFR